MLIVDLGQSGSRISFNDEISKLSRGLLQGEEVADALSSIFDSFKVKNVDLIALSCTGFNGIVRNIEDIYAVCQRNFGDVNVAIIDDGLAGFVGSLNGRDGVALTIGGGVVAIGGKAGKFSHRDGLGSIFGDEGGGYWLGKLAITKALGIRQGRGSDKDFLDYFKEECSVFDQLTNKNNAQAASLAISTAKKVLMAADEGLQTALKIVDEGAHLLSQTIIAAWLGAEGEVSESPEIVIKGGPASNLSYVNKIKNNVSITLTNSKFVNSNGDNIEGARWIALNIKEDIPPLLYWQPRKP